jgi:hypothetical protein
MKSKTTKSSIRRTVEGFVVLIYTLTAFLVLDFAYSILISRTAIDQSVLADVDNETSPRIAIEQYDHGLSANFAGYVRWSGRRYSFYTNNFGLRDAAVREVPLRSDLYRVILIGDSFIEGMGVTFDDSLAGLLFRDGKRRRVPVEFLNAAVVSYSPIIFYRKIKHLLETGLRFDEVIVFSDISDVQDEATNYFCIDEEPQYKQHCGAPRPASTVTRSDKWLEQHLLVTHALAYKIQSLLEEEYWTRFTNQRAGWTMPGFDVGSSYAPLGIDGGIARSTKNMKALADLLKRHGIALTVVVYPWPFQLTMNDRNSRQAALWRDFCRENSCKAFINLFPAFFSEKDMHQDWRDRLFIRGDVHLSVAGNEFMFRELRTRLLP